MYSSTQHAGAGSATRPREGRACLRRRNPRDERQRRCEQGVTHAERLEDAVARKVVERLSADAPHNLGEQHEIQVTVDKLLARRRFRNLVGRARDSHGLPLEDILQR